MNERYLKKKKKLDIKKRKINHFEQEQGLAQRFILGSHNLSFGVSVILNLALKIYLFTYTNNNSPLLGFPASNGFFKGSNNYRPLLEKSTFILL